MQQSTDHHSLVNLQYASAANPKLFSLIRNLTSNLTFARREDRNNPGNPGNANAEWTEYNVLLTSHLFTMKKKKRWRNLVPAARKIDSDVLSSRILEIKKAF